MGTLEEKAVSKKQQQFMGMALKCKETGECASEKVKKTAGGMSKKELEKFAGTKHKGLPEKVSEGKMTFRDFLTEENRYSAKNLNKIQDEIEHYLGVPLNSLEIAPGSLIDVIKTCIRFGWTPEESATEINNILSGTSEYFTLVPPPPGFGDQTIVPKA